MPSQDAFTRTGAHGEPQSFGRTLVLPSVMAFSNERRLRRRCDAGRVIARTANSSAMPPWQPISTCARIRSAAPSIPRFTVRGYSGGTSTVKYTSTRQPRLTPAYQGFIRCRRRRRGTRLRPNRFALVGNCSAFDGRARIRVSCVGDRKAIPTTTCCRASSRPRQEGHGSPSHRTARVSRVPTGRTPRRVEMAAAVDGQRIALRFRRHWRRLRWDRDVIGNVFVDSDDGQ